MSSASKDVEPDIKRRLSAIESALDKSPETNKLTKLHRELLALDRR